jgi:hypothetical protein
MLRARQLPGITITTEPMPVDGLPRMDVAAFVGFASSGPINVPVAIEDISRFDDVFGPAPNLAWDAKKGSWQKAHLAAVVRDFFEHGGRRCWVVRVAATGDQQTGAISNEFTVPGLLHVDAGNLVPAMARARSEGSWSDNLRVGASLLFDALEVDKAEVAYAERLSLVMRAGYGGDLQVGDMLQFDFSEKLRVGSNRTVAYLSVEKVHTVEQGYDRKRPWQAVEGRAYWFRPVTDVPDDQVEGTVQIQTPNGSGASAKATIEVVAKERGEAVLTINRQPQVADDWQLKPVQGSWLTFKPDAETVCMWLLVDDEAMQTGQYRHAWWEGAFDPLGDLVRASRVTIALRVRDGKTRRTWRMPDLHFSDRHPRFWGYLPDDQSLFRGAEKLREKVSEKPGQGLWEEASSQPRFPLAGPVLERDNGGEVIDGVFIPLGLGISSKCWSEMEGQERSPLQRDGMIPEGTKYSPISLLSEEDWTEFLCSLFLDEGLRRVRSDTLLSVAFDRQYVQVKRSNGQVRPNNPIRGLHTVIALEDVSLLAIPDAIHHGWKLVQQETQTEPIAYPDKITEPKDCPDHKLFQPRPPTPVSGPLRYIDMVEGLIWIANKAYRITEDSDIESEFVYGDVVQIEFMTLEGRVAVVARVGYEEVSGTLNSVSDESVEVDGHEYKLADDVQAGNEYIGFDVKLRFRLVDDETSVVTSIRQAGPGVDNHEVPLVPRPVDRMRWELLENNDNVTTSLLEIHQGAIRLAAARADIVAVLGMPEYFLAGEAQDYRSKLGHWLHTESPHTASYAALYYPSIVVRESDGELRRHRPEGAVCGIIASRGLLRGAWVPPANERVRNALALYPHISADEQAALYRSQVNIIRSNGDGFVLWGADTLSEDADLIALNVRRLLILLRRLALREGQAYVFEPNNSDFRRLVKSAFDRYLANLYTRGAFTGNHPSKAYRVVIDETVNPQINKEKGRLIVELRVAPSSPLSFITVRLLQTDAGTLVVQEG